MLIARILLPSAILAGAMALAPSAFAQCPAGTVQTGVREDPPNNGVVVVHPLCKRVPAAAPAITSWSGGTLDDETAIRLMTGWASARNKVYAADLAEKLRGLALNIEMTVKTGEIIRITNDMAARRNDPALTAAARSGKGPILSAAGQQTFEDCAVFALASAASLPYGVVAAHASEVMRTAPWRTAAEQSNPEAAIKSRGLYGGEVVILAEEFGVAQLVPPTDFPATLAAGKPVMVRLLALGSASHQVVLSKTFSHAGEAWYEVIDSNNLASDRTYITAAELDVMIEENGVSFAPRRN